MIDTLLLTDLGKGLLVGAFAAFVGFIKNLPDGASFDWKKAGPSVIIGGLTGLVASYKGVDMALAGNLLSTFGIVALVNQLWSAAVKTEAKVGFVSGLIRRR